MVRPQPAADAAQAAWLGRLRRALTFGPGKRLVLLRGAGPEHLKPVADMLWALGDAHICVRAAELSAVPHGATGLLVLRRDELDRLNGIRPFFSERALRMVLLADDETAVEALRRAPDLMDWVSEVVEAEPLVPGFVVESIRLIADAFPGFEWVGEPAALTATLRAVFPGEAVDELPADEALDGFAEAVDRLPGWGWVDLSTFADSRMLRLALATADRRDRLVVIGASVPGWPSVEPEPASWPALDAFDPPISGAEAARADCERAALRRDPIEPGVDALTGEADLPTLRATLRSGALPRLRRRLRRRAHRALRDGDTTEIAAVAAWADRARTLPRMERPPPRVLIEAAMPLVARCFERGDPAADAWLHRSMEPVVAHIQSHMFGQLLAGAGRAWQAGRFEGAERELATLRRFAVAAHQHDLAQLIGLIARMIESFLAEAQGRPSDFRISDEQKRLLRETLVRLIEGLSDDPWRSSTLILEAFGTMKEILGEAALLTESR